MTLHIWLLPKFSCELIRNFIINALKKKRKKIVIIIVSQFGGKGTLGKI